MVRYVLVLLFMFFSLIPTMAYEFDLLIVNNSAHEFSLTKELKNPGTLISDEKYFSKTFKSDQVLPGKKLRCYITLSIDEYVTNFDNIDCILLKNSTGSFFIKFSKITADNHCPIPLLVDSQKKNGHPINVKIGEDLLLGGLYTTGEEITDGSYNISCYFDREQGGYIVDIKNR